MTAPALDMGAHLALDAAARADSDYHRAYDAAARWDCDCPPRYDVYAVTAWAVRQARDEGWLLGCWYRDLTGPWRAVTGTDPMEAFK